MAGTIRRVVTGHDANGKSVVLSDGPPPQHHDMHGPAIGADFIEIWNSPDAAPQLDAVPSSEPNERAFAIMPATSYCGVSVSNCGLVRSIGAAGDTAF